MEKKDDLKIKYDSIAIAVKYAFGSEGEVPKVVASGAVCSLKKSLNWHKKTMFR